jgi:phosphosulfolactate synthase (CoM biosynthesis protein A)
VGSAHQNQQQFPILRFGSNVSLGTFPEDILALEALRSSLRETR